MLRDENKYSEDNIKYRDKKDELQKDMMMAKLTNMQKSVLKKKFQLLLEEIEKRRFFSLIQ